MYGYWLLLPLYAVACLSQSTRSYGVDVSFPIHYGIDPKTPAGKRYANLMDGCAQAYSKRECQSTETARLKMSLEQPRSQHNYTDIGFKKIQVDQELFDTIQSFYHKNKENKHAEQWGRGYTYTNHWVSPTYMVSAEDPALRGSGPGLKARIWNSVKPIIEEWTGHTIKPTSLYGIREYTKGAILATHVDRLPLVSSCIINVYQEVNEPWPLEVYDHQGRAHNVSMLPGDMVLYESHTVLHGRPFPLNGSVFANIFVHFEPIDHAEMNRKAMDSRKKLGQPAPEYKEDDGGGDPVPVVPAVDPAEEARLRINHASSGNRLAEVQRILHADPSSVNTADRNGWMPLHEAVRGGHTDLVKFLVEMGADIGAVTNGGGTALWWARRLLAPGHSAIAYLTDIGAPEGSDTNTVL